VFFDDYFAGADTNSKIVSMNAWAKAHNGQPTPAVVFDAKRYDFWTPIELWSGLKLKSMSGLPSREFGRQCVLNFVAGAGMSMFRWVGPQTNQSYPSDGSPRDLSFEGIEFRSGLDRHFIEPATNYVGRTLWCATFRNCGWIGFDTIWIGFGDNVNFATGQSHFQAGAKTLIDVGGSENVLFGNEAKCVWDSGQPAWASSGQPWCRIRMQKSIIGSCMITNRYNTRGMEIAAPANNLRLLGTDFDCMHSDPSYGAQLYIASGENILINQVSFKGGMTSPSQGPGGVLQNQGFIHVANGRHIVIEGNGFQRQGNNVPPTNTPLVACGPSVPVGGVAFGFNAWAPYEGYVRETVAGQIVTNDPRIKKAAGAVAATGPSATQFSQEDDGFMEYESAMNEHRFDEWNNDTLSGTQR
jgi:hypothetical protein